MNQGFLSTIVVSRGVLSQEWQGKRHSEQKGDTLERLLFGIKVQIQKRTKASEGECEAQRDIVELKEES